MMFVSFAIYPFANERENALAEKSADSALASASTAKRHVAKDHDLQEKTSKLKYITITKDSRRYVTSAIRFAEAREYRIIFSYKGGGNGTVKVSFDNKCSVPSSVKDLGLVNIGSDEDAIYTDTVFATVSNDAKFYIAFFNEKGACPEITDVTIIGRNRTEPVEQDVALAAFSMQDYAKKGLLPIIIPSGKVFSQNAAAAADRAYAQSVPGRRRTVAERLVYEGKNKNELERLQAEILNRAMNEHPDPEIVRGIIESALTRGVIKSSFDTLVTYIDPIKGAENLRYKYSWTPPEISAEPDLQKSYNEGAKDIETALDFVSSDGSYGNQTSSTIIESPTVEPEPEKAVKEEKKDTVSVKSALSKKLDDVLFKKGKVKDFTWSWIPFRKIALLTILLPLLWLLRRMRWSNDTKKSTLQSQKDRLSAAKIRHAIFEDEKDNETEIVELSPTELARKNRLLVAYVSDLAAVAEFNNKVLQQFDVLTEDTGRNATLRNELLELKKKYAACNDKLLHEDFETIFDNVYPNFFSKLSSLYPHLSYSDLSLCAYLRLGIPTKEIASLTNREIRSVESMRNRLRKKLELESGQDFIAFFTSI